MTQVFHEERTPDALQDDLLQLDLLLKEAIAKLSGSFIGAHQALSRQQALPDQDNPECGALAKLASDHLESALTALQFEDIASQLIASAMRHIGEAGGAGRDGGGRGACAVNRSVPQQHMESGSVELF